MVSFPTRRSPFFAGGIAIAAVAAPGLGFAQALSPFEAEQRQLLELIEATQTEDGPYAIELLEPLTTLGVLYGESGDRNLASAALARAIQVVRANHGLHTLEQASLLERQIRNEEARGNDATAWELEQNLLEIAARHSADLRTAPIYREIAEKRMQVLERYLGGEFPPQIVLGCYYDSNPNDDLGSCHSGSRGVVVNGLLSEAWRNYSEAIGVMLRNGLHSSDEVHELEMALLRSSFTHGAYYVGRRSLRRMMTYVETANAPFSSRIDALLQRADWDLVFVASRGAPMHMYAMIHEEMKRQGEPQESIDALFSPAVPIPLPTFMAHPLVTQQTADSTGYVDVTFELSKFGGARKVTIAAASPDTTRHEQQRLVRQIYGSRFRPQVSNGEFARSAPVTVRYYIGEDLRTQR